MPPRSSFTLLIAETIAIGSELLIGGRSDGNSLVITELLGRLGIEVRFKSIVGDDIPDIVSALNHAVRRAGVVVLTGGLGPTIDDCTREAIARATGKRLAVRKDALDGMITRLAQWGRTPNAGQRRQALIPSGSVVLPNSIGSAPGFWLTWKHSIVISLPGVPREMDAMMRESVVPLLAMQLSKTKQIRPQAITRLVFHTFGLPEADVDAKLKGLVKRNVPVDLGLLASPLEVLVSLTSRPREPVDAATLQSLSNDMRSRLGEWLF